MSSRISNFVMPTNTASVSRYFFYILINGILNIYCVVVPYGHIIVATFSCSRQLEIAVSLFSLRQFAHADTKNRLKVSIFLKYDDFHFMGRGVGNRIAIYFR